MEFVNLIKIHDRVAVHTQKPGGIEEFVQLRQALAEDVILRAHVNPHQVSCRLQPLNVTSSQQQDLFSRLHWKSTQELARQLFSCAPGHRTPDPGALDIGLSGWHRLTSIIVARMPDPRYLRRQRHSAKLPVTAVDYIPFTQNS